MLRPTSASIRPVSLTTCAACWRTPGSASSSGEHCPPSWLKALIRVGPAAAMRRPWAIMPPSSLSGSSSVLASALIGKPSGKGPISTPPSGVTAQGATRLSSQVQRLIAAGV
ncbi:hypothetical protein CNY89_17320 [Amaricoccus sp. HAR-UPW-R2A-40]|nr:hypothetical protein CNY89_17320 [Amaricoccus sp. HAR-UPW-R2A-40]